MRLKKTIPLGRFVAKIYKDTVWDEHRVKFFEDGKHVGEDADYHCPDYEDAENTANHILRRYNNASK